PPRQALVGPGDQEGRRLAASANVSGCRPVGCAKGGCASGVSGSMDETLRRLERNLRQGDVATRARWLAEALRAHALDPSRVALLAHLGDEAAQAVAGSEPVSDFPSWAARFADWGKEAAVRTGAAMASLALEATDAVERRPEVRLG